MSAQRARRRAERDHEAALRTAARAAEQERRERLARRVGTRPPNARAVVGLAVLVAFVVAVLLVALR